MSPSTDEALTQELEALIAAKEAEQRRMRGWFGTAFILLVAVAIFRRHAVMAVGLFAASLGAIALGVRHHLRAAKMRGEAMEKILQEAFKRAGQEPPKGDA